MNTFMIYDFARRDDIYGFMFDASVRGKGPEAVARVWVEVTGSATLTVRCPEGAEQAAAAQGALRERFPGIRIVSLEGWTSAEA